MVNDTSRGASAGITSKGGLFKVGGLAKLGGLSRQGGALLVFHVVLVCFKEHHLSVRNVS